MVEALFYSLQFVQQGLTKPQAEKRLLEGQLEAAKIYDRLIKRGSGLGTVLRQNYACCLKRIADATGSGLDYDRLKQELSNFPTETELQTETITSGENWQLQFLWQNLMEDAVLFGSVNRIPLADYTDFWIRLLDAKVSVRDWKADLEDIESRNPSAKGWEVKLN